MGSGQGSDGRARRWRGRRGLAAVLVAGALLVADPLAAMAEPETPAPSDTAEPTPTPTLTPTATPTPTPTATPARQPAVPRATRPAGPPARGAAAAQRAVAAAQMSVVEIEVRLAELTAVTDEANVAVQRAGEAYAQAQFDAEQARGRADLADERSRRAALDAEDSRRELMVLARQMSHSGGSMETLEAVLSADGFSDIAARTAVLSHLTGRAGEKAEAYRAALLVAQTLQRRAAISAAVADETQRAADEALAAAQELQAEAQQRLDDAAAERETLLAALAAARQTSAAIARARQGTPGELSAWRDQEAALDARGATGSSYTVYGLGTGRTSGTADRGVAALTWAMNQVGKPYGWGATGPDAFDCSGLTSTAWRAAGVGVARTSRDQYKTVQKIAYADLRLGDLVFWTDDPGDPGAIYHVAMWAGGGMIVEAPRAGLTVRVVPMRWEGTMPYAGRP